MDTTRSEADAKDRVKKNDLLLRQLITKKGKEVADPLRCHRATVAASQPKGVELGPVWFDESERKKCKWKISMENVEV